MSLFGWRLYRERGTVVLYRYNGTLGGAKRWRPVRVWWTA
jgi:hypothetical protein